ncbi:MAG: MFS transporter [Dehalococcoidia bacterium]|nr:MFS transporter [Dehalococcoidia bacterium]
MPDSSQSTTGATTLASAGAQGRADAPGLPMTSGGRVSSRLMWGLAAGHGVKHFCQNAWLILMPEVRAAFALSDVAVGGIFAAQQIASGVTNVPAGILTDMFRRRVALMLTLSMLSVATGYFLIAVSQSYWMIVLAGAVMATGASWWHSPAIASLATRYPEKRGLAVAMHLTGAQAGDTISPVVTGLLLGGLSFWAIEWSGLSWRVVAFIVVVPAAVTSVTVMALMGKGAVAEKRISLRQYVRTSARLARNGRVLGMTGVHALRGAAHSSFVVFLVIYMNDVLGYSKQAQGAHIALLTVAGIASTPFMGRLSDRIGRRPVIVTAMSIGTALMFTFLWADEGAGLAVALGLLGIVLFAVMPIIAAAAMDATEKGSEGTSTALLFAGGSAIGAVAPLIAGAINQSAGFHGVVWFAVGLSASGALLAFVVPAVKRQAAATH